MGGNAKLSVSTVIRATAALIRNEWQVAAVALIAIGLPWITFDLTLDEDTATRLGSFWSLFVLLFQVIVTHRLLDRLDALEIDDAGRRLYPRAFGQNLLSGLAILIGLLCLIIPGFLLAARWSISLVMLIARDMGVVESLRASWAMTAGHTLTIAAIYAVLLLPVLAGAGSLLLPGWSRYVVSDLLLASWQVLCWFTAVALYGELQRQASAGA